ncbi:MAG: hypothetical protein AAGK32_14370, partial [Actinomycetota bacterium]
MDTPNNFSDHNNSESDDDGEDLAEVVELHANTPTDDPAQTADDEASWRGDADTEATLVDGIADNGASAPVRGEVHALDDGERPPIVPTWLRAKQSRRAVVAAAVSRRWWWLVFHTSRVHVYWLRLVGRSPRGVARVVRAW